MTELPIELVLCGGGMKGLAHCGAIKSLIKHNLFNNFTTFVGASIGSLIATFLSVDIPIESIQEELIKLNFDDFKDESIIPFSNLFNLIDKYGLYDGNLFVKWVQNTLNKYIKRKNITFKEVHERYHKKLVIVSTNLNRKKQVIFSYNKTPEMNVVDAVRASMAIPLIFTSVVNEDGDTLVDGGVTNNFPIDLCSDNSLGIMFKSNTCDIKEDISDIYSWFLMIIKTMMTQINDLRSYKQLLNENVIVVNTGNIATVEFDLDMDGRNWLIKQGIESADEFIKKKWGN